MHIGIMSDISEMNVHRFSDRHFNQRRSGLSRHLTRIIICAVCCPKARHRNRNNLFFIPSQHIERLCRDKQSQCRIHTARNADNRWFCIRMRQPFFQTHCLNCQDFVTNMRSRRLVRRHERMLWKVSRKNSIAYSHMKRHNYRTTAI